MICWLLGGTGPVHEAVMRGTVFISFLLTSGFSFSAHTPIWNPADRIIMALGWNRESRGKWWPGERNNKWCSIIHPRVPELKPQKGLICQCLPKMTCVASMGWRTMFSRECGAFALPSMVNGEQGNREQMWQRIATVTQHLMLSENDFCFSESKKNLQKTLLSSCPIGH